MSKKTKIIMLISIGVFATITYKSCTNKHIEPFEVDAIVDTNRWENNYPQLKTISSTAFEQNKPNKTNSSIAVTIDKSQAELIGKITNPYGIRDDLLEFIVNTIPANNPRAIEAAIHSVKNFMDVEFSNDPEEARQLYPISGNIMLCLDVFLNDNHLSNKVLDGLNDLYTNTAERKVHSRHVDAAVISGHIYGAAGIMSHDGNIHGYSDQVEFCKKGGIYWK